MDDDDTITVEATLDLTDDPNGIVYLGDVVSNAHFYGIVGPPGPPGPAGEAYVTFSGTRENPVMRFVIDGWEYSFPSKEMAVRVRDELMRMTLEGEL